MQKQIIFSIAFLLLGMWTLSAQQQNAKWSVGVYAGVSNYRGDLSRNFYDPNDQILNIFDNTDYLSYGLSIAKSLSESWSLRLMASQGEFIANDRGVDWNNNLVTDHVNFSRSLNVRTAINDLSLLGVWSLANNKILPEEVFLAPYFLVGGGFSTYKNYADLYTDAGDRYYYWNDNTVRDMLQDENNVGNIIQQDGNFETALEPLKTEGVDYKNRFIHATVGAGLKFRLWKRMSLNIESLFRFTSTDYLDDVRGNFLTNYDSPQQAYAANPALRESLNRGNTDNKKDRLHFTTISLHYHFGRMPKPFVAPAILIGDLYDIDKYQKVNKLPSSSDTTYQPISVIPTVDLDSFIVTSADNDWGEIEELEIPEIDMTTDDTLEWTSTVSLDSSIVRYDLPERIDTFYRVLTPSDSIFYTEKLEMDTILTDQVDTLVQMGGVVFIENNTEWEPMDGEDWEAYNSFSITSQLSDTTASLVNSQDTILFPQANNGGLIDLATTRDSLTEIDRFAIANPVIEQPPLTIENTILDTTEIQWMEDAPLPVSPARVEREDDRELIISSDPRTDSLYWQVSHLSSTIAKLREEQKVDRHLNETVVNQRLAMVQAELDSLRANQDRNNYELSKQWRSDFQLAMTEIEKQIREVKNPSSTTTDNAQAEIAGMRREMESMRTYLTTTQQKNRDRSELEEYKRQLWLYEIQSRNLKEQSVERQKLETEINSLKESIQQQQEAAINAKPVTTPTPVIIPTPINTQNEEEVKALKEQVANLNNNMAEMRRLLEQQNNQSSNSSEAELLAIKAEIAKLSNLVNANATGNESDLIRQLKAELAATRKQLSELSNKPAPIPAPPTIITNTVVPPSPTAREAIGGQEKQLVFFKLGASELDASSMQIIQSVAQMMNQYPEIYAELEGYTDPSGNADANLILSGKRATAVQRFLVQYGIATNRLVVIPRGEDPASNASYGRRVAIKLNIR